MLDFASEVIARTLRRSPPAAAVIWAGVALIFAVFLVGRRRQSRKAYGPGGNAFVHPYWGVAEGWLAIAWLIVLALLVSAG